MMLGRSDAAPNVRATVLDRERERERRIDGETERIYTV